MTRPVLNTPGRRWRRRRALVAVAALAGGVPTAWVADALDMSKSGFARMLRQVRSERPEFDGDPDAVKRWVLREMAKTAPPLRQGVRTIALARGRPT